MPSAREDGSRTPGRSRPERTDSRSPAPALAALRAATMVGGEFCIDIGSEFARRTGLTDEQLLSLHDAHASGLFDGDQLLVIDLASEMTATPGPVDDGLIDRVQAR